MLDLRTLQQFTQKKPVVYYSFVEVWVLRTSYGVVGHIGHNGDPWLMRTDQTQVSVAEATFNTGKYGKGVIFKNKLAFAANLC